MTDGTPTDREDTIQNALSALASAQKRKAVTVFPIGIGQDADMTFLNELNTEREAVRLRDLEAFSVFFKWLSASMTAVSASSAHGSDDAAVAQKSDEVGQVALPDVVGPKGWATL
jgi:uncharacterized protein YegL